VEKVLAPHNARPKAVPLIKRVKECDFLKYLFFPRKQNKMQTITNKDIYFFRKGPTRI